MKHALAITTLLEIAGTLARSAEIFEKLAEQHPEKPHWAKAAEFRRNQANEHLSSAEALEDLQ